MCGITGFLQSGLPPDKWNLILQSMTDTLAHRGPDDCGTWFDFEAGVGLGHRRLAIFDISSSGHQPMFSESGRYGITYNGAVYNFRELREELQSSCHNFYGHSDTEVILASIEEWGLEAAVSRFVGMFAIALWDRKERILHLVRDRIGIKPLYYGWVGGALIFGSELKALKVHPNFGCEIDRNALTLLLRHNYIPAPYSIYKGISKLLPGTILSFRPNDPGKKVHSITYWSLKEVVKQGLAKPYFGTQDGAIEYLEFLLRDAVKARMAAEVPVGAFLSGGIDSSTMVALMQEQSVRPVKTFSIGFHEREYNEAVHAKDVARRLGTDHTELYVTVEHAMEVLPKLPALYDEPFSDSSQIPTFILCNLASQNVKVSLAGDGGDELFAGYRRYDLGHDRFVRYEKGRALWKKVESISPSGRKLISKTLSAMKVKLSRGELRWLVSLMPKHTFVGALGDQLRIMAETLDVDKPHEIFLQVTSHWKDPKSLVLGATEPRTILTTSSQWGELRDFTEQMMYLDTMTYLPDDLLTKVDRASMGVGLEVRVPFLDHRVVEFVWQLPLALKIKNGQSKWLLRQVLYRHIPPALIDRPKMGFMAPIGIWLRGRLRPWAEELLDERRLQREGVFNPKPIRNLWTDFLRGVNDRYTWLWDVLMFQAWLEHSRS
jgi:asparagine synthase (glutamine-hydrolysing)